MSTHSWEFHTEDLYTATKHGSWVRVTICQWMTGKGYTRLDSEELGLLMLSFRTLHNHSRHNSFAYTMIIRYFVEYSLWAPKHCTGFGRNLDDHRPQEQENSLAAIRAMQKEKFKEHQASCHADRVWFTAVLVLNGGQFHRHFRSWKQHGHGKHWKTVFSWTYLLCTR